MADQDLQDIKKQLSRIEEKVDTIEKALGDLTETLTTVAKGISGA